MKAAICSRVTSSSVPKVVSEVPFTTPTWLRRFTALLRYSFSASTSVNCAADALKANMLTTMSTASVSVRNLLKFLIFFSSCEIFCSTKQWFCLRYNDITHMFFLQYVFSICNISVTLPVHVQVTYPSPAKQKHIALTHTERIISIDCEM